MRHGDLSVLSATLFRIQHEPGIAHPHNMMATMLCGLYLRPDLDLFDILAFEFFMFFLYRPTGNFELTSRSAIAAFLALFSTLLTHIRFSIISISKYVIDGNTSDTAWTTCILHDETKIHHPNLCV